MALFKHKGGMLQVWNSDGSSAGSIQYGPGLHIQCPECKVPKGKTCVTVSGKSLNKSHKVRLRR